MNEGEVSTTVRHGVAPVATGIGAPSHTTCTSTSNARIASSISAGSVGVGDQHVEVP